MHVEDSPTSNRQASGIYRGRRMHEGRSSEKRTCRTCRATLKGKKEIDLHHRLCTGNSMYSDILSHVNNYERPGRERYSRHHHYRPSSSRSHRSKSMPSKCVSQSQRKFMKKVLSPQGVRRLRHSLLEKDGPTRSKSIPSDVGRSAKCRPRRSSSVYSRSDSLKRKGRQSLSSTRRGTPFWDSTDRRVSNSGSVHTSLRSECGGKGRGRKSSWVSNRSPGGRKSSLELSRTPRQYSLSNSRGKASRAHRRKSVSMARLEAESSPSPKCSSTSSCVLQGSNDGMDQSLVPSLKEDSIKKHQGCMDSFKTFYRGSKIVPASNGVSRRLFSGGQKVYFCCKLGCTCRKCHYITRSVGSGRRSSFLRRCYSDCSCTKCHLYYRTKDFPDTTPTKSKSTKDSPLHTHSSPASPDSLLTPRSDNRRCRERSPSLPASPNVPKRSRHTSRSQGRQSKSPVTAKRKLEEGGVKEAVGEKERAGSESLSPKRKRERKEVLYVCEPCGMDLHSWCLIRKHLLSSEHLQAVSNHRRKQTNMPKRKRPSFCDSAFYENFQYTQPAWDVVEDSRSPQEHLMAGLNLMRVNNVSVDRTESPQPFTDHKSSCSVPVEPSAVPEATGSIEGASSSVCSGPVEEWEKSRSVNATVESSGYSSSVDEVSHGTGSVCHADMSQANAAQRNVRLAPSPKKLIIHHIDRKPINPISQEQQTTFVRIDYNKKLLPSVDSSHVKWPHVHREGNFVHRHFECACITGDDYNCIKVKGNDLPQPFVNMGNRCDSEDFQTKAEFDAGPTFHVVSCQKGRSSSSDHGSSKGSSQTGGTVGQVAKPTNKMIRIDYNQKSSTFSSDATPPLRTLTYIGSGDNEKAMSTYSSSSIHCLEDEGALGERLQLSDSEDSKDNPIGRDMLSMDNGRQTIVLDGQKFLNLLFQRLNEGGLCCHRCGNKIDGNSVVKQLYNCCGKSQNSDGPSH